MYERVIFAFAYGGLFAEGIEQKKAKMFKIRIGPARAFPATSRERPIARKRPEIENVLGESKKAAKDTNLKNKDITHELHPSDQGTNPLRRRERPYHYPVRGHVAPAERVSYNSYLIADQKTALIDTVETCYFDTFLEKIRAILGDRPIDYLIINHMEPDHSGSIGLIRRYYPQVTLVASRQALGMLEGFYGLTENTLQASEDTVLELGLHRLSFQMTPMVHWPETMMTFDAAEGSTVLRDAFGTFGA